jgi:hypothetical protein
MSAHFPAVSRLGALLAMGETLRIRGIAARAARSTLPRADSKAQRRRRRANARPTAKSPTPSAAPVLARPGALTLQPPSSVGGGAVVLPPVEVAVPPVDAGVPPVEAGVPPVEGGVPPVVPPVEGVPPVDAGVPPVELAPPVELEPPVEPAIGLVKVQNGAVHLAPWAMHLQFASVSHQPSEPAGEVPAGLHVNDFRPSGAGCGLFQLHTASPQAVPGQSVSLKQGSPSAKAVDATNRDTEPTRVASDPRSKALIQLASKKGALAQHARAGCRAPTKARRFFRAN